MQPDTEFLVSRGWDMTKPVDICHLDCPAPGYRKIIIDQAGHEWEIILCLEDALVLEEGAWEGDYDGALTPAYSRAAEWPWRALAEAG
jgi:hypothetical protein